MKTVIEAALKILIRRGYILAFFGMLCLKPTAASADEQVLRIAVASNFYDTARSLALLYRQQYALEVSLSSGSSGLLASQILQGAPFDVFLSADESRVVLLQNKLGLSEDNVTVYAIGKLMLVSKNPHQDRACEPPLDSLLNGQGRILLANPKLAPYGATAQLYMKMKGIEDGRSGRVFVYGNNIAQTAQMFQKSAITYTWLAASQKVIFEQDKGRYCFQEIVDERLAPIKQSLIVVHPQNPNAKLFQNLLSKQNSRQLIKQHGYDVP